MRIYDLAGAPMMMKLADHRVRNAGGVDAVFDVKGQKPHDFVPGAFIAKKAGAIIRYRNGKEISYEDLEDSLRDFDTRTKYVIACTRKLSDELLKVIR